MRQIRWDQVGEAQVWTQIMGTETSSYLPVTDRSSFKTLPQLSHSKKIIVPGVQLG